MRVLLDEDIPVGLRLYFRSEVEVETVEYRGWKGLKNGELLRFAQRHFDVLVTMDNNLPYQQPVRHFDLAVAVLRSSSEALGDLIEVVPELERMLSKIRPGQVVRVFPAR